MVEKNSLKAERKESVPDVREVREVTVAEVTAEIVANGPLRVITERRRGLTFSLGIDGELRMVINYVMPEVQWRCVRIVTGVVCPWCESPSMIATSGHLRCANCGWLAGTCVSCNAVAAIVDGIGTHGPYCRSCAENDSDIFRCVDCGSWRLAENGCNCQDCADYEDEPDEDEERCLYDYSYKPRPNFYPSYKPQTLYLGMELELECGGAISQADVVRALDDVPLVYCKSDGSLNCGAEIVSHPMTFDYAMKSYPYAIIEQLRQDGCRSGSVSTCGIHIHLSREAFTEAHLYKFLRFHYDNPNLIRTVAQRRSTWARLDERKSKLRAYAKKQDYNYNRYMAVNLQNDATIELRYFKGNLREDRIRKAFQFAQAAYEYTSWARLAHCKADPDRILSAASFVKWLQTPKRTKRFPQLAVFLDEAQFNPTFRIVRILGESEAC